MSSEAGQIKTDAYSQPPQVEGGLKRPQIWAIGGGKGGVGKSFISSSLGISLSQMGHSVIIVDLDLGGANMHTCLGAEIPPASLSDFINNRTQYLDRLIVNSPVRNLKFISGANDALNVTAIQPHIKERLAAALQTLPCDYLILDLGAGTSDAMLDFFIMADRRIVAFVPEPTSIENAYRFIKASFYRKLRSVERNSGIKQIIDEAMDHRNQRGIRTPADLIKYVAEVSPESGHAFQDEMASFKINLVINQVRTRSDIDAGFSIQSVCKRYFGINTNYAGYLDYDNAVWQSLRKKRPLILEFPYSLVVGQLQKITKHLVDPKRFQGMI